MAHSGHSFPMPSLEVAENDHWRTSRQGADMPHGLEIDVDQLMEQISASRMKRVWVPASSQVMASHAGSHDLPDLSFLHSSYDVYHVDFTSHRKIMGRVVVFIKQVLRQFMSPILQRQCLFNAASARVASHLQQQTSDLRHQLDAVRDQQATDGQVLRRELEALIQQQSVALQALHAEFTAQLQSLKEQFERGLIEGNGQPRGLGRPNIR
jgi:hypothetical protein